LVRQGLGHADGVGVFKAQLLQLGEAVAVQLALDVVVDRHALRNVHRVLAQEGGEDRAVVGDHQVAGVAVILQGVPVVHLGHLILNGDGQVRLVLHQHLYHVVHQLGFGVVAVIEKNVAGAAAAIGQQQDERQYDGRHRDPHFLGAAPALAHLPLEPAHDEIQHHGDDHKDAGGRQNQGHIGDPDGLGDDAAQTAAAHESCEYRSADGVYHRDADAGEHRGEGQGELHHQHPVGLAHAHAPGGFLHTRVHLLESQAGVPHDGQQGVQRDAGDDRQLAG
ncbi:thymidylate synthase, partial [Dysosmobacter welbionis]